MDIFDGDDPFEDGFAIKDLQAGDGRSAAERIARIRMAMEESARTVRAAKGLIDFFSTHRRGERQKPAS